MPLLNSVTTPYAEALLQVVNENSQTEEIVSEVKQLLKLLADRQRIGILNSILERFLEIYRENSNIALATVTSAVELTDEQKGLITQKIINICLLYTSDAADE